MQGEEPVLSSFVLFCYNLLDTGILEALLENVSVLINETNQSDWFKQKSLNAKRKKEAFRRARK